MRLYNIQVFDDLIAGTTTIWYSTDELSEVIGRADMLVIGAVVTNVSGTSPTLSIDAEHCADAVNYTSTTFFPINNVSITNGLYSGIAGGILMSYVRCKITLGGTNPQCRLKVYVTGRAFGRRATGQAPYRSDLTVGSNLT